MNGYKKGDIASATITAIEKYGAFAQIDETYSGLIHISEITSKYVRNITDYIEIGDVVEVKILDDFKNPNQLKLSLKDTSDDLYKVKKRKIKETVFGFYLLKSALPGWIDKKMEEINKKS